MARENAIEVEGVVVEVLSNGTCQVELANGHRVWRMVKGALVRVKLLLAACELARHWLFQISGQILKNLLLALLHFE